MPIAGHVVDRKGQPVAGAKVYLCVDPDEPLAQTPITPPVRATSGRRRVSVHGRPGSSSPPGLPATATLARVLAAFAEGYGPAWTDGLLIDDPDGNRLELVDDDVPVAGRLIDLEGRPLPDVTVPRGPGRRHADGGPLAVAMRDSKGPEVGFPVLLHDVQEMAAGKASRR